MGVVKLTFFSTGTEAKVVETTESTMEVVPQLETEEVPAEQPMVQAEVIEECQTTEQQEAPSLPVAVAEERTEDASNQMPHPQVSYVPVLESPESPEQQPPQSPEPAPVVQLGPDHRKEKEREEEVKPSTEQQSTQEEEKMSGEGMSTTKPSIRDSPESPTPPISMQEAGHVSMDTDEAGLKEERSGSPIPPAPQADTQEAAPSTVDMEDRGTHSEEEEEFVEEEEEQQGKEADGEGHHSHHRRVKIKQEPQDPTEEQEETKPDQLLLDEMSNQSHQSHGDESSSGFLGSPAENEAEAEPDAQVMGEDTLTFINHV